MKGGQVEFRGAENAWYQNGQRMKKAPDRQSSAGMHAVLEYLGGSVEGLNVGWGLCFPNCSLPAYMPSASGVPLDIIVDQRALLMIEQAIERMSQYYIRRLGRSGVSKSKAREVTAKLTRGIGFVTKLGIRQASSMQRATGPLAVLQSCRSKHGAQRARPRSPHHVHNIPQPSQEID